MKKRTKNLVSILSLISLIIGISGSIPSFLRSSYFGLGVSGFFVILGLILLAIAFSD